MTEKNTLTRDLPKPIVYAFVGVLALGVIVPLGFKVYNASQVASTVTGPPSGANTGASISEDLAHWGEAATPVELGQELQRNPSLVSQVDNEQWTLLHFSAAALRADLISVAVKHGADLDAFNAEGQTPLHVVLFMEANAEYLADRLGQEPGDYEAVLRALLDAGADPNATQPGSSEGSPIAWAQVNGLQNAVDILAEFGGVVDSNHPTFPSLTVAKGDDLFPTWNALSDAGFQEIPTAEVASAIDPDRAGEVGMAKTFLTPEGGCIVIPLGESGKVGTLIYWPDAASSLSDFPVMLVDI